MCQCKKNASCNNEEWGILDSPYLFVSLVASIRLYIHNCKYVLQSTFSVFKATEVINGIKLGIFNFRYPTVKFDNDFILIIPPPHNVGGGGYNGLAFSRPSVRFHYHVRSINPIPIEGFSSNLAEMFTSTRGCAEPMSAQCEGHN